MLAYAMIIDFIWFKSLCSVLFTVEEEEETSWDNKFKFVKGGERVKIQLQFYWTEPIAGPFSIAHSTWRISGASTIGKTACDLLSKNTTWFTRQNLPNWVVKFYPYVMKSHQIRMVQTTIATHQWTRKEEQFLGWRSFWDGLQLLNLIKEATRDGRYDDLSVNHNFMSRVMTTPNWKQFWVIFRRSYD